MGGGAYGLDLVRPLGLDAIRLESGAGVKDRPGGLAGARLRGSLRAWRRARRSARPDPTPRDARRRRAVRRSDRDRREAAGTFTGGAAARSSRGASLDGSSNQ